MGKIYNSAAESFAVINRACLMGSVKPKVTWKTVLLPAIGIAAFIIYLYLFQVDIPEIIATIKTVNMPLYVLAAFLVFFDTLFYALAWRSLLNFLSVKLSVLKAYLYVWYGTFVDIIIPAESISGEISRAYLVMREQGNEISGKVAASLVAHRLISMSVGAISVIIGTCMILTERQVDTLIFNLSLFFVAVTVFFVILLILFCIKEAWTRKIIEFAFRIAEFVSRGKWKLAKFREDALKAAKIFHDSMKEFSHAPRTLSVATAFSTICWILNLIICYLVFLALDFQMSTLSLLGIVILTQSIVTAVKSIPVGVPFEVGLPEITMTTLYVILGVPFQTSATATILSRILTLWLRFFVSFAVQQWIEIKAIAATSPSSLPNQTEKV